MAWLVPADVLLAMACVCFTGVRLCGLCCGRGGWALEASYARATNKHSRHTHAIARLGHTKHKTRTRAGAAGLRQMCLRQKVRRIEEKPQVRCKGGKANAMRTVPHRPLRTHLARLSHLSAQAGIRVGDELLEIDGDGVEGNPKARRVSSFLVLACPALSRAVSRRPPLCRQLQCTLKFGVQATS